jgi:hypothetical protein
MHLVIAKIVAEPSPIGNIDRYVPGRDTGKPPIRINPLPNPLSLDFQVDSTGLLSGGVWSNLSRKTKSGRGTADGDPQIVLSKVIVSLVRNVRKREHRFRRPTMPTRRSYRSRWLGVSSSSIKVKNGSKSDMYLRFVTLSGNALQISDATIKLSGIETLRRAYSMNLL